MSRLTDYAENHLLDWLLRGQTWTLPGSLYVGLASAASDSAITELSGTGYARQAASRALATWAGTQGSGTTLASSGTSHATSNNAAFDFGTAGASWGTANYVVLLDASTSGNALAYLPTRPVTISSGNPVSIAVGAVSMTLGLSGGCSDYLANKLIDRLSRASLHAARVDHVALYTAAPSNAGGGTEVSGGSYARIAIASSLAAWAGTQSAGSTTASTGTSGVTSNNAALVFPTPTATQGTAGWLALYDVASGSGNQMFWAPLAQPKTLNAGTPPRFAAGTLSIRFA